MTNKTTLRRQLRAKQTNALRARLVNVETVLYGAIDEIDDIGERMHSAHVVDPSGMDPDQVACFAANSVQGTLALLRELGGLLPEPKRRRR